jgi:Tfp pilus assembly protein PilO
MHSVDPSYKVRVVRWSLHGLGALIFLTIGLLAHLAVNRPLDAQTAAYAQRTDRLQAVLRDGERLRKEHARLSEELALARQQAALLEKRIPDEPREADFLAQVSRLADEVGLRIRDYRPGVVKPRESYSTMRVDLICEGNYDSICRFVDGLSRLPRHSTIVRLEVDSAGKQKFYSTNISLELYAAGSGQADGKAR